MLHAQIIRPMQTLSNMVAAIREEDFSFRLRGGGREDSLADLIFEINSLAMRLQQQKVSALEATALLKKVMMEIDVAVFTFDQQQRLRIVNRAGEQLMGRIAPRMLGLTAEELGLDEFLQSPGPQTVQMTFPGKHGRWAISHTSNFAKTACRTSCSSSPISAAPCVKKSARRGSGSSACWAMSSTIRSRRSSPLPALLARSPYAPRCRKMSAQDMQQGLRVIENRVESLNRFMQAYTRLARMPAPSRTRIDIGPLVQRAASLERRLQVKTLDGPAVTIDADPDQIEQVLINLIRNAVDASLDPSLKHPGSVEVGWRTNARSVEVFIRDQGPGLLNSDNLFVPFFTTKHGGSGIGLILSRQIAEAHGGVLQLANRKDRTGCEAVIALPIHV